MWEKSNTKHLKITQDIYKDILGIDMLQNTPHVSAANCAENSQNLSGRCTAGVRHVGNDQQPSGTTITMSKNWLKCSVELQKWARIH